MNQVPLDPPATGTAWPSTDDGTPMTLDEDRGAAEGPTPAEGRPKTRGRSAVRNLIEWVVVIGGALLVATLLRTFLFQTFYIPSGSMIPTLVAGDRVIVNKLDDDHQRGDIIVFERPDTWGGEHHDLIKRVMAFEGESIEAHDNTVYIDGAPLTEPYLEDTVSIGDFGPITVPEGNIFVMGDNRAFSSDSRVNGPVPEDKIVGRAFIRIWPLDSFGSL